MKNTPIYSKIYAGLLGGAIGDAMGGPVEGREYAQIEIEHGVVDTFLPYTHPPDYHNQFANAPGAYTDDTRLKHLLCRAILAAGDLPLPGDFAQELAGAYYAAQSELERGFLEEYVRAGHYGEDHLIFAGQPTNGAIMMNSPLGLVCPGDPHAAFAAAYRLAYITDGYAKHSAAILAAAVAAAMAPGATVEGVIELALQTAQDHARTGPLTRAWQWYDHVYALNERLVRAAVEIAQSERDVLAVRPAFYLRLKVSDLGSEAAQTLAVALGMFAAAGGDFRQSVIGAVNYGRDNDSYASIAGALAGAFNGMDALPPDWVETVQAANPEPDMGALALDLCQVALSRHRRQAGIVDRAKGLFEPGSSPPGG